MFWIVHRIPEFRRNKYTFTVNNILLQVRRWFQLSEKRVPLYLLTRFQSLPHFYKQLQCLHQWEWTEEINVPINLYCDLRASLTQVSASSPLAFQVLRDIEVVSFQIGELKQTKIVAEIWPTWRIKYPTPSTGIWSPVERGTVGTLYDFLENDLIILHECNADCRCNWWDLVSSIPSKENPLKWPGRLSSKSVTTVKPSSKAVHQTKQDGWQCRLFSFYNVAFKYTYLHLSATPFAMPVSR